MDTVETQKRLALLLAIGAPLAIEAGKALYDSEYTPTNSKYLF